MSDLLRSYRSLPALQRFVVGGVALVVAIVLLVNLSHILGGVVAFGLAVGLVVGVYALIRAIRSRL
jgi:uncharacterized membrane protein